MSRLPKQPGFTLLELLITSLLGAMLLMGATAMFGLFMRNSSFTNIRKQINLEGQQILSVLEYNLRNARSVTGCNDVITTETGPYVRFTDNMGRDVVIYRRRETASDPYYMYISVGGLTGTFRPLHSNFAVASTTMPFTCKPAQNANYVTINFSLDASGTGVPAQNFQSTVQIRNTTIR